MYPEVEQYIAAVDAATTQERSRRAELSQEYYKIEHTGSWEQRRKATEEYYAKLGELNTARQAAYTQAWEGLKASEDPLVVFIAEHCYDYTYHAVEILKILPAGFDAMLRVAEEGDWCEVFDRFAAAAVRKRLLVDPRSPQRRKLEQTLKEKLEYRSDLSEVLELVESYVKAEVKRAVKTQNKQPA